MRQTRGGNRAASEWRAILAAPFGSFGARPIILANLVIGTWRRGGDRVPGDLPGFQFHDVAQGAV
jgi:hypothetical protein